MTYEGVTFVEPVIKEMSESDFIRLHKNAFWQDRKEDVREKMLRDVYARIVGKTPGKKKK